MHGIGDLGYKAVVGVSCTGDPLRVVLADGRKAAIPFISRT